MSAEEASGTGSGAIAGASLGSAILPGVGTAIGAGLGAIGGFLTGMFQTDARNSKEAHAQAMLDRQRALAKEQYGLNIRSQDQKVQTDDAGQLTSLLDRMKGNLSLEQKLALIDGEVKNGLGTESAKIAMEARNVAVQENDLYGTDGARAIQQLQLDNSITNAKDEITGAQQNRDAGLAEGSNVSAALGLSGQGIDAQATAQAAGANRTIASAARSAGFLVPDTQPGAPTSVFDQALQLSLAGPNLNQRSFDATVKRNEVGFLNAKEGLALDTTSLIAADQNYRESARIARDNADVSFDQMQWGIDQSRQAGSDWLTGAVTGVATGISMSKTANEAGLGFNKWWGSTFPAGASA